MSVERWTEKKLDGGYFGQGSEGWCIDAADHIRTLYAQLDAKDALIRAGDRMDELIGWYKRSKIVEPEETENYWEKLEAAQAAYQSLRKP